MGGCKQEAEGGYLGRGEGESTKMGNLRMGKEGERGDAGGRENQELGM